MRGLAAAAMALCIWIPLCVPARSAELISPVIRGTHYFVLVNQGSKQPRVGFQHKRFGWYHDRLSIRIADDGSRERFSAIIEVDGQVSFRIPGSPAPYYLVATDVGLNGVTLTADRPWGVVAGGGFTLATIGAVEPMYLYVPGDCSRFELTAQAASAREGGRITVIAPDGTENLVIDGELDKAEKRTVTVPERYRNATWRIEWGRSQSVPARLDDLSITVDGDLAALLWPVRDWAERHGLIIWERHKAAVAALKAGG